MRSVSAIAASALCVMLLARPAVAQSPAVQDLEELMALVTAMHPAHTRYMAPERLDLVLRDEVRRLEAIDQPDDLDLALSLHRLLAKIGDAHFAVALPSFQPGARVEPFLLPLLPIRIGERVFVDASEPGFPVGTELVELIGRPVREVLDEVASIAFVDGDRPEARLRRAERDFTLHFHIAYGVADEYEARVRLPDGEERSVTLPAVRPSELGALQARRVSMPLRGEPPRDVAALPWMTGVEGGAQLLRLPGFGGNDPRAYRARVDSLFDRLAGSEPVVLDLRGNNGGFRTHGIAVLERLLRGPYAQWTRIEVAARRVPERFRDRVSFPFGSPEALQTFPGERRDGRFVFEGDPLRVMMSGAGPHHDGRVIVLIDDGTNSAAVEMVAALRSARPEVVLVGSETKGECGRHVGEIPIMFTGRTQLRVLMSVAEITHVSVEGCRPGRGFEPDVEVEYSEADFIDGVDPYLRSVGRLLGG